MTSNFAQQFENAARPSYDAWSTKKGSVPSEPLEEMESLLEWVSSIFEGYGIVCKTEVKDGGGRLNMVECSWLDHALVNPIFCMLCRTMFLKSLTWTSCAMSGVHVTSIADGARECVFSINPLEDQP